MFPMWFTGQAVRIHLSSNASQTGVWWSVERDVLIKNVLKISTKMPIDSWFDDGRESAISNDD